MPVGPQIIAFGNVQATFILSVALTPVATAGLTTAEQSFTILGLQVNDQISGVNFLGALTGFVDIVNFRTISNNTLGIAFANTNAGSQTFPAGNFYVEVNRPYPGLSMTGIQ